MSLTFNNGRFRFKLGRIDGVSTSRSLLLVGTDYFIKWVEAEPLANIRDVDVKKFF